MEVFNIKKVLAFIMAVAVLASMFAVSLTVSAEGEKTYRVSIDAIDGQKSKNKDSGESAEKHYVCTAEIEQGSDFKVTGWMLMTEGFEKLQYNIDGGAWKDAVIGQYDVRADVHAAFPGFEANNVNIGFGGGASLADCKNLAVGEYTVLVRGCGKEGTTVEVASITLSVLGEIYIPDPTVIALDTNATRYDYTNAVQGQPPVDFLEAKPAAVQFKVPAGKEATQLLFVQSPNWSNPTGAGSDVLVKIFAWNGDYDSTIAGNPIDSLQIYGHQDNSDLIIQFSKNMAAGEYLLVLEANGGKSVGTWAAGAGADTLTFYVNGAVKEGYIPFFAAMLVDAKDAPAPQTGDMTVAAFAVIAVVALAAVVILKKRVNA